MPAEPRPIYGVTPFTMLDFPGRTACILWLAGCNMRCGYCHNPDIVRSKGKFPAQHALDFLMRRQGVLDGVVFSGGEATLSPALPELARAAKRLGYAVKLDTNGTRPDRVAALLDEQLLDYVALDYKAPQEKWEWITHCSDFQAFSDTLDRLCQQSAVPFEVRTTVHTALLDENDIGAIAADLNRRGYKGTYYVQNVFDADNRPTLKNLPPQTRMLDIGRIARDSATTAAFRNFQKDTAMKKHTTCASQTGEQA